MICKYASGMLAAQTIDCLTLSALALVYGPQQDFQAFTALMPWWLFRKGADGLDRLKVPMSADALHSLLQEL